MTMRLKSSMLNNSLLIFLFFKVSRLEITGLKIVGPNKDITKEEALADRLIKSNKFKGRGIALWSGKKINLDLKISESKDGLFRKSCENSSQQGPSLSK